MNSNYNLGCFRRKWIVKVLSVLLLQTFLFYNIGYATPDKALPTPEQKAEIQEISIDNIGVSKDVGSIKERYRGRNGKLIVHIQDAHCNYEAQTNISKIIENFSKDYNINVISVEGADGYIDTSWFRAFPDAEIRREVADYFMKRGEITGVEFLSITKDYPIKLYGAENRDLYIKNLNAFTSTYPQKEEIEKYLLNFKTILGKLKSYMYTKELREFDNAIEEYREKKITLSDYAKALSAELKRHNINLRNYTDFAKLMYTLVYEDKIDFKIVDQERADLIDKLSKALSKEKLQDLVVQSFSFKVGKVTPAEYYQYLKDLSAENGIDLAKDYPNLSNYVIYTRLYEKINNEKLFDELDAIKNAIKDKLFKNNDQRTLSACWDNINILLGLINIKLSNKEFDYYKAHKSGFKPEFFTDFIKSKVTMYNLSYNIEEPSEIIEENLPELEEFYEIATKRDRALVDNTIKVMKKEMTDVAVLVTGGFHTEGIKQVLEEEGFSYIVVCPNITKDAESPYIQVLTNQKTPFEELLVESATPAKEKDLLAPYIIARAIMQEGKAKLPEAIRQRADRLQREWVGKYVAFYVEQVKKERVELNIELLESVFLVEYGRSVKEIFTGRGFKTYEREIVKTELLIKEEFTRLKPRYQPEASYLTLDEVEVEGKTVGVRIDINVTLKAGKVQTSNRIKQAAVTLKELADKGAKVVALAHQGRPGDEDFLEFMEQHAALLQEEIQALEKEHAQREHRPERQYEVLTVKNDDLFGPLAQQAIKKLQPGQILLLKNVRSWKDEQAKGVDHSQSELVQNLQPLFDLYVIDGFSVAHRAAASVVGFTGIPNLAGRLMQKELEGLAKATEKIEKPYVMSLGGLKIDDYLGLMERALKEKWVDNIITAGALGQILLMTRGTDIGKANVDFLRGKLKDEFDNTTAKIKELDNAYKGKFIAPVDYIAAREYEKGKYAATTVTIEELSKVNLPIYDIGPKTREKYLPYIDEAKTAYTKGPLGAFDVYEEFAEGTRVVFNRISQRSETGELFSFGGGGDTDMALQITASQLTHQSLAGGATLEFLAGKTLPGVVALEESAKRGITMDLVSKAVRADQTKRPETPGVNAVGKVVDVERARKGFDEIIRRSYELAQAHELEVPEVREGFRFVRHDRFTEAIDKYNEKYKKKPEQQLPYNVHPGRGGDIQGHKLYEAHIDSYIFNNLTKEERLTTGRHEKAHLDIYNAEEMIKRGVPPQEIIKILGHEAYNIWTKWLRKGRPQGQAQEDFINNELEGCDTRPLDKKIESLIKEKHELNKRREKALQIKKENLRQLQEIVEKSEGVSEVLAICSGDDGRIVERILAGKAEAVFRRDGKTRIMAHEEPTHRGQWLGLLDAVRDWYKRMATFVKDSVSLGIMMPGKGRRLSPFSQRMYGIKPFMPMLIRPSKEAPWLRAMTASLYTWNLVAYHLKRLGFRGIAWKWGDEPQIAATDLNRLTKENFDLSEVDIVRFGSEVVVTEDLAQNKEWLSVDENGSLKTQVRRGPRKDLLAKLGIKDAPEAKALIHIGSPAFSYLFIEEALRIFGDWSGWIDVDGYLIEGLTLKKEAWEAEKRYEMITAVQEFIKKYYPKNHVISIAKIAEKLNLSEAEVEEILRELETEGEMVDWSLDRYFARGGECSPGMTFAEREKIKFLEPGIHALESEYPNFYDVCQRFKANIEERRGHPLQIKVIDFGEDLYWGDIGQLIKARQNLHLVAEEGPEGDFARELAKIADIGRDEFGNIIVGKCIYPKDGSVRNSALINSNIYGQVDINCAVLIESNLGDAKIGKDSVVLRSTVMNLTMGERTFSFFSIGESLNIQTDWVHTSMPRDLQDIKAGMEDWWAPTVIDGKVVSLDDKEIYEQVRFGNPRSFAEQQNIMRQREKGLATIDMEIEKTQETPRIERMKKLAILIEKFRDPVTGRIGLRFGTSGLRDYDENMTDMECYINTRGFVETLIDLGPEKGGINRGDYVELAADFRPSSPQILRAIATAITDSGCQFDYCGNIPTQAVAYYSMYTRQLDRTEGRPCIMVTGSHIPYGRNGVKFYMRNREVLKHDEKLILEHVAKIRNEVYAESWEESMFDKEGYFKEELSHDQAYKLKKVEDMLRGIDAQAALRFIDRYKEVFGKVFEGEDIVFWQQTTVGRNIIPEILEALGAKVHRVGLLDARKQFVSVDTEKMDVRLKQTLRQLAADFERVHHRKPFAVISADGDSDRPVFCDENGEFLHGDKLGLLAAMFLKPTFAAIPKTANYAVVDALKEMGIKVKTTDVGSPFVIKAMEDELERDEDAKVLSWEVNGGFLTGCDWDIEGKILKALPTRDAVLPLICALLLAKREGMSVSELIDKRLPHVYTSSDLIDNFPREEGRELMNLIRPADKDIAQVDFDIRREKIIAVRVTYLDERKEELDMKSQLAAFMIQTRNALGEYFTKERGFASIEAMNFEVPNSVMIIFENKEVSHLRPSGNADQFRNYTTADTLQRAEKMHEIGINEIIPEIKETLAQKLAAMRPEIEEAVNTTPGIYSANTGKPLDAAKAEIQGRLQAQRVVLRLLTEMGVEAKLNEELAQLEFPNYVDRGNRLAGYMVDRHLLPVETIFSLGRFEANKHQSVYSMTHIKGEKSVLHAATVFPQVSPLYPGTVVYQSTGSHFQATSFDFKYVREGYGIQLIPIYDRDRNIVKVYATYLTPGTWMFSLPGRGDIVVNLGGLLFSDRSFKVSDKFAKVIAQGLGLSWEVMANEKWADKLPASGMPYIFYMHNLQPHVAIHPAYEGRKAALEITWIEPFKPEFKGINLDEKLKVIFSANPKMMKQYEEEIMPIIETDEFAKYVMEHIVGNKAGLDKRITSEKGELNTLAQLEEYKEVTRVNKLAQEAFEKIEGMIREGKPFTFLPNIRNYMWGPYPGVSSILPTTERVKNISYAFVEGQSEKVAERWFVSQDRTYPSCVNLGEEYEITRLPKFDIVTVEDERGYVVPIQMLFGNYPEAVFGQEHLQELGANVTATAKLLEAAENLSLQIHRALGPNAKPEFWIPLGSIVSALIGLRQEIGEEGLLERLRNVDERKIEGAAKELQNLLNMEYMNGNKVYSIDGGMLHALLRGFVFEGSYNPQVMEGATKRVSDWARGRRIEPEEAIQIAKESGTLRAISEEEFTSRPIILKKEPHSEFGLELLWARAGGIFERFEIAQAMSSDRVVAHRQHALFVRKGELKIVDENRREIATLVEGEEYLMPAYLGEYTLRAIKGPAEVYMWYSPLKKERAVYSVSEAVKAHVGKLAGLKVDLVVDKRMYRPDGRDQGSYRREEARLQEALGADVRIVPYDGNLGLDNAAKKTIRPGAIPILIATANNLKSANRENAELKKLLSASRTMALPDLGVDAIQGKGWFFTREIEGAALLLGATSIEDIQNRESIARSLQNLMSQFTGRDVGIDSLLHMLPFNEVKGLLSKEELENPYIIYDRLIRLIKELLITLPIRPFDAREELYKRREVLWSV